MVSPFKRHLQHCTCFVSLHFSYIMETSVWKALYKIFWICRKKVIFWWWSGYYLDIGFVYGRVCKQHHWKTHGRICMDIVYDNRNKWYNFGFVTDHHMKEGILAPFTRVFTVPRICVVEVYVLVCMLLLWRICTTRTISMFNCSPKQDKWNWTYPAWIVCTYSMWLIACEGSTHQAVH